MQLNRAPESSAREKERAREEEDEKIIHARDRVAETLRKKEIEKLLKL